MSDAPMTKQRLESYIALKLEIDNQLERLARMRNDELIPAVKEGGEEKHTGGAGDRLERAILRRMEYEERILPQIEASQAEMEAIEDAIAAVRDPMEREVLRLRYTDGDYCRLMPWREVALRIFGDNDDCHLLATYRLHGKALKSICGK